MYKIIKHIEIERSVIAKELGEKITEPTAEEYCVSLGGNKYVLGWLHNLHILKKHWILHFKMVNFRAYELYLNFES
jgi:hypothetical protein